MFRILARSARTGIVTDPHPLAARLHRAFPVIDFRRCTACGECARACPTGAIAVGEAGPARTVSLSYGPCISCRECLPACPEGAVTAGNEFDLAAYTREQLTRRASFDPDPASGRAAFRHEESLPGPSLAESAEALKARIRGRFGRSLHVRQVDAGSCNGCELEIGATANPVFDLERFGIHFVASPRHADLLLVTGPITRNMEIALRRARAAPSRAWWWRSAPAAAAAASSARGPTRRSAASTARGAGGRHIPGCRRRRRRSSRDCSWPNYPRGPLAAEAGGVLAPA
jgi:ferredoxin